MLGGLFISCVGYAVARVTRRVCYRGARSYTRGGGCGGCGWPASNVVVDAENGGLVGIANLPFQRFVPKYGSAEVQMMDLGGGHVHARYDLPEWGSPQR